MDTLSKEPFSSARWKQAQEQFQSLFYCHSQPTRTKVSFEKVLNVRRAASGRISRAGSATSSHISRSKSSLSLGRPSSCRASRPRTADKDAAFANERVGFYSQRHDSSAGSMRQRPLSSMSLVKAHSSRHSHRRFTYATARKQMTLELHSFLEKMTKECQLVDIFHAQSGSKAHRVAHQLKKQWDNHLKRAHRQNLTQQMAITQSSNTFKDRSLSSDPLGIAQSQFKVRIPNEFSRSKLLPNISQDRKPLAREIVERYKLPKMAVSSKRLTPLPSQSTLILQQEGINQEPTVGDLLNEENHQEAAWEDMLEEVILY